MKKRLSDKLSYKLVFLFLFIIICGCNEFPDAIDLSLNAEEGKDITAIFEGCGEGARNGYLFCRIAEGTQPSRSISLHFPQVKCKRDSCIEFQFMSLDGSLGYGGGILNGETSVDIPISKIIDDENEIKDIHDGEYRVLIKLWWMNKQDEEFVMRTSGIFRLFVVSDGYSELVCNDPEKGWGAKITKKCFAQFSTGFRTALCGECGVNATIQ